VWGTGRAPTFRWSEKLFIGHLLEKKGEVVRSLYSGDEQSGGEGIGKKERTSDEITKKRQGWEGWAGEKRGRDQ